MYSIPPPSSAFQSREVEPFLFQVFREKANRTLLSEWLGVSKVKRLSLSRNRYKEHLRLKALKDGIQNINNARLRWLVETCTNLEYSDVVEALPNFFRRKNWVERVITPSKNSNRSLTFYPFQVLALPSDYIVSVSTTQAPQEKRDVLMVYHKDISASEGIYPAEWLSERTSLLRWFVFPFEERNNIELNSFLRQLQFNLAKNNTIREHVGYLETPMRSTYDSERDGQDIYMDVVVTHLEKIYGKEENKDHEPPKNNPKNKKKKAKK